MLIYATIMITGAVIMVIELLGTRILAPFYGNTLYVWASMISTALIFLSLGYYLGGTLADRKPDYISLYSLVLLSGILLLLVPIFSKTILLRTNILGPRFGALITSIILFSLVFTTLGAISPYAIRLKTRKVKESGSTAGNIYAVTTVGSFLGTIITGFYLIPNLSLSTIIALTSLILIILPLVWFFINKEKTPLYTIPLIVVLLYIGMSGIVKGESPSEILYSSETPYGHITVVEKNSMRFLLVDGSVQNCVKDRLSCARYINIMAFGIELFDGPPENALFVGLGAGVLPEALAETGIKMDVVEIDPEIVEVAREYFNFTGEVKIVDGRQFIRNSETTYDLLFLDAFNGYTIPSHLFTQESFLEAKKALTNDGILVINTPGWLDSNKTNINIIQKSIFSTLKETFTYVYMIPSDSSRVTNIVFFSSDRPLDLPPPPDITDGLVLTDEYTPLEFWAIEPAEMARNNVIDYFGASMLVS